MVATTPPVSPGTEVVLLTYFSPIELPAVLEHLAAIEEISAKTVYIGSYGANAAASRLIREHGFRYAPIFSIQPGTDDPAHGHHVASNYLQRNPAAFTEAERSNLDHAHHGPIPLLVSGKPLPADDQFDWGQELGRRYRDSLRLSRRHMDVDAWQFDELVSQVWFDFPHRRLFLDFLRGILNGLRIGRPATGDKDEPGLVWCAGELLRALPHLPRNTPGLGSFLLELDRATTLFIGEEYPLFSGSAAKAADSWAEFQHSFASEGRTTARFRLSQKYVAAFTPGIDQQISAAQHLNGRIAGQSVDEALTWKSHFVKQRRSHAPAGLGEYCFLGQNADAVVLHPTITNICVARPS